MARLRLAFLASLVALAPTLAWAGEPEEHDDFIPIWEEQLLGFDDFGLDTGWIPNNSPVQMRFYASAANTVGATLAGEAIYDWPSQQLRFVGDPDAGFFSYDVGIELYAGVKVDVALVQWESDLLGPYDYAIDELAWFTPYLLAGNPDRPAAIASKTEGFTLASVPIIPDIVILSGNLDIDLAVDVEASLVCNRIEVAGPLGEAVFVSEGEAIVVDPGEGPDDLELEATLYCQLVTMPSLIVRPHLVMQVGFDEYDIAGIDIPIELPVVDQEVAFDPIALSFPRWQEPSDTGESGGESGSEGNADEVGDESESGTDDAGLEGEPGIDDGCNCASDRPASGAGLLGLGMLALGLGSIRRRRDR
ncbi:MYXO-CTERM sorting domain-containing protein [Nannocystaceae bacterium ST9]